MPTTTTDEAVARATSATPTSHTTHAPKRAPRKPPRNPTPPTPPSTAGICTSCNKHHVHLLEPDTCSTCYDQHVADIEHARSRKTTAEHRAARQHTHVGRREQAVRQRYQQRRHNAAHLATIAEGSSEPITFTHPVTHTQLTVMQHSIDASSNPAKCATCRHCAKTFPSGNQLYKHLRTCILPAIQQRIAALQPLPQPPTTLHAPSVTAAAAVLLLAQADPDSDNNMHDFDPTSAEYQADDNGVYSAVPMEETHPLPTGGIPMGLQVTLHNEARTRSERVTAFYDSGAPSSVITPELCARLNVTPESGNGGKDEKLQFSGFTEGIRTANHTAVLQLKVGREELMTMRFWVCKGSPVDLLIGRDNMTSPDTGDDGRGVWIDPDLNTGCIKFKRSGRSYPATRARQREAATFLTDTIIPPQCDYVVQVQTRAPNAKIMLPRAWVSATLFTAHDHIVTRTDELGRANVIIRNIDSEPTTLYHGTPLIMEDTPTLLQVAPTTTNHCPPNHTDNHTTQNPTCNNSQVNDTVTHSSTEIINEHHAQDLTNLMSHGDQDVETTQDQGLQPLMPETSDDLKRGTSWGSSGEHDKIEQKSYMSKQELRRFLRGKVNDNPLLTPTQRTRLRACLEKNIEAFSDETNPIGYIKGHDISFRRSDSRPIFIPPRPMNAACAAEATRQIEALVANKVMQPTNSCNNFPLVMVRKGVGQAPRIAVDLRMFNQRYQGTWQAIPCISDCLAKVTQHKIFSALDCTQSFHMIGLRTDDGILPSSHQIAITLPNGMRYAYSKLPFGCKDSSFSFTEVMNKILLPFQEEATAYIDDTTTHSADIPSQIAILERVLPELIKAGVRLNPRKSEFCVDKINILGHTVSHQKIEIQAEKLEAITKLAAPRNRKELQSLIGVLSWSRRFVHDYANIVEPLTRLLRKDENASWPSAWQPEQERAFRRLQKSLLTNPSLASPNFSLPFEVLTDASQTGIGAVLMQSNAAGEKCVVEYYSKQLDRTEQNYATCEKECYAILKGLQRFRKYLLMANRFTIIVKTDHRGLQSLYKHSDESSRLFRWALKLNEFDYNIQYMSGKGDDVILPDGLSRARVLLQETAAWVADEHSPWQHVEVPTDYIHTNTLIVPPQPLRRSKRKLPTNPTPEASDDHTTDCPRKPWCIKEGGHRGNCKRPTGATTTPSPIDDETYIYDSIVCRAHRNGLHGFRVRWRGYTADDDTYELTWRMRQEVNQQHVDTLISDFVRRERTGDIDVYTPPGPKYTAWENVISPTAPTPRKAPDRAHMLRPFPTAVPVTDVGFCTFDGIDLPQLLQHQQLEPDTADFIKFMSDSSHQPDHLSLQEKSAWRQYARTLHVDPATGLLMRHFTGTTGPHLGMDMNVIMLPAALLDRAFKFAHDLNGHTGVHATMWTIRTRFHAWKLEDRLRDYIHACEVCTRADRENRQHPYGSIPVSQFADAIGFDFLGPFKAIGPNQEKFLAIMVDHATKYTVVFPTKGETAEDAVEALTHYVLTMGTMPRTVFSDQGSFTGIHEVWTALLARFGINAHQALSKNPRGDSHAESMVKQVTRLIRKVIQEHPDRWPEASKWATYAYNCKYHNTIGTSPFYALHAVEPRQPIDFLMPRAAPDTPHASIAELANRIERINNAVTEGVAKLHASYAQRNKDLRGVRDFKAGDLVWKHRVYPDSFETAGIDKKFHFPFYPEPYVVLERRSLQHSRIRLAYKTDDSYEDIHHLRLKPCVPRDDAIQFRFAVPIEPIPD